MLTIQCQCGEVFHADEGHVGRAIRCRKCGQILDIRATSPTLCKEEPAARRAKTDGIIRQQNKCKPLLRSKKTIAYALVGIGLLLIVFFVFNSLRSPSDVETGLKMAQPKASTERGRIAIEDPARSTAPAPQPMPRAPSRRSQVPIKLEPVNPNRLRTGSSPFAGGVRSGHSEITVDNGTDTDAIVRVVRFSGGNQQKVRNFYMRSHDQFVANSIPPGEYVLRIAFGTDWNSDIRRFNFRKSFSETQTFTIEETTWAEDREDGEVMHTRSSKLSITLHKVPHGNFKSHPINEDEFWQ